MGTSSVVPGAIPGREPSCTVGAANGGFSRSLRLKSTFFTTALPRNSLAWAAWAFTLSVFSETIAPFRKLHPHGSHLSLWPTAAQCGPRSGRSILSTWFTSTTGLSPGQCLGSLNPFSTLLPVMCGSAGSRAGERVVAVGLEWLPAGSANLVPALHLRLLDPVLIEVGPAHGRLLISGQ